MLDLTVVIPAYNEEKRIAPTLREIGRYFSKSDISCEVIVVVNNTTDNTVGVVNKISNKYPFIKAIDIKGYTGKGGAIAHGVKIGKGKYIAYQDADGSSSVHDLVKGLHILKTNPSLDLVMGSRYMRRSQISGDLPAYRFILSRIFNFTVRAMFGLNFTDTQCAVKVMKRHVAKNLLKVLVANKWTVDVNLLVESKFNNYEVIEFPLIWEYKPESKLNVKSAFFGVGQELISLKVYQINKSIKIFGSKLQSALSFQD